MTEIYVKLTSTHKLHCTLISRNFSSIFVYISCLFIYFRSAAAESLPCLIECAQIRGPQYVQEMWAYICPELLKAIEAEPESALVSEHLNSMARCVEILGVGCLNEPSMEALVKIMVSMGQAQIGS